MTALPSMRPGLLRHPVLDQMLIYDTGNDKLHLLDGMTSTVVELMDSGDSADAIAAKLDQQQGTESGSQLLALALDELTKAELTEGGAKAAPITEVTRRQMLQKFAGIGAAVLIPAIVSLTPSRAYAASTCGPSCTKSFGNPPGADVCLASCRCCSRGNSPGTTNHVCSSETVTNANCHSVP